MLLQPELDRIPRLDTSTVRFPDPRKALNGLIATGGDLSVTRLLEAYRCGIFPWYEDGGPVIWWSPDPRCVIDPAAFRPSRSLRKKIRNADYEIRIDSAFGDVITACRRGGGSGTWITAEMSDAYLGLFDKGHAHSIECFMGGELAGGLYGVGLGRVFFGESMFHHVNDASKIGFAYLMGMMAFVGSPLVDCQFPNPHLTSLGAIGIPRESFLGVIAEAVEMPPIDWQQLKEMLAQDPQAFVRKPAADRTRDNEVGRIQWPRPGEDGTR